MTTFLLLRLLARRWYVVVAILALTGFAFVSIARAPGAYVAQAEIVFVAPGNDAVGSFDDRNRETLVGFAAVIEREFHAGQASDRLAEGASLHGAGIDQGYQVLLPNSGGQWQYNFSRPVLSVRVVGPSSDWVLSTLERQLERISALATERQQQSGVAPGDFIRMEQVPAQPVTDYIGPTRGTTARALAAFSLVGLLVAAVSAVAVDVLIQRLTMRANRGPRAVQPEKVLTP